MNQSWKKSENGALMDVQEECHATNTAMVGPSAPRQTNSNWHGSGSFTLIYVDSLQRMMSHTVRLVATPVSQQSPSRPPSRGGVINLPNPFKVLRATHFGAPEVVEVTELAGRVEVDTQIELGVVLIEGTIIANRTVLTNDGSRAIFWTESGLTVGTPGDGGGYSVTRSRLFKHNQAASGRFGQRRYLQPTPSGSTVAHSCWLIR